MTYNYRDLGLAMRDHRPLPEVAKLIASMLKDGFKADAVIGYIFSVMDENVLEHDYELAIEDLVEAMEGNCHRNYLLHPSQFVSITAVNANTQGSYFV